IPVSGVVGGCAVAGAPSWCPDVSSSDQKPPRNRGSTSLTWPATQPGRPGREPASRTPVTLDGGIDMPTTNIQVSTAITGPGERTVCLAGEIDVAVVDRVESLLRWSIRDSGAQRVVVDVSCLTFIDARGSRSLGTARQQGEDAGVPVTI